MKNSLLIRHKNEIAALIVLVVSVYLLGTLSIEEEIVDNHYYCEMVELFESQKRVPKAERYGHPDYKNVYDQVCKD